MDAWISYLIKRRNFRDKTSIKEHREIAEITERKPVIFKLNNNMQTW